MEESKTLSKMTPPVYADVGKPARDLFSKGYHFGLLKLECKTKTPSGVEFTADMTNNSDTNKVAGNCEVKFKVPEYGKVTSFFLFYSSAIILMLYNMQINIY